ncbi:MAG: hypothetical protein NTZ74_12215 [Chloroflexi bacterium]|nr:hypothetical protein [Chloroflexota bacterium]
MVVSLGIISLLQLTILPGLIITRLVKLRGFWENLLLAIGLSPLVNYFFVLIVMVLGIYNQTTTHIFLEIETLILFILLFPLFLNKSTRRNPKQYFHDFLVDFFAFEKQKKEPGIVVFKIFFLAGAIGVILYYVFIYGTQYSSVFSTWDAVISWNRWAVDWFRSQLPADTTFYPQLMPINWSMAYQMIGDTRIQFFAKTYMGFIEIFVLLTLFVLGLIKQKLGFFIGVTFTGWLQFALGSQGSGYMDTPVSFWGLLSIICLLFTNNDQEGKKYIFFGAVFAAMAGITKQAGLWIAVVYPIFLYFQRKDTITKKSKSPYFMILLTYLVIILPWYAYIEYRVFFGQSFSNLPYILTLSSQGSDYWGTIAHAFILLFEKIAHSSNTAGIFTLIILGVLISFSFCEKWFKRIGILIIIPFFISWVIIFSYDIRNINLIVPFVGMVAGVGLEQIIYQYYPVFSKRTVQFLIKCHKSKIAKFISSILTFLRPIKKYLSIWPLLVIFILVPLVLFFFLPTRYSDSYLLEKSIAKQKLIGGSRLNQVLYEYKANHPLNGKILTDYQYLNFMPGFEGYYEYGYPNSEYFIQQFNDPQIGYLLINTTNMSQLVKTYVDQLLEKGEISILIYFGDHLMYSTCRGVCK